MKPVHITDQRAQR